MARIECASQGWGLVLNQDGYPQRGVVVVFTDLAGVSVPVYDALVAGTQLSPIRTNNDGTVPGFIEGGTYLMTVGTTTRRIEAVSASSPLTLNPAPDAQALDINPTGAVSISQISGGAANIDNTNSTGTGMVVYSNRGADARSELVSLRSDNVANTRPVAYVTQKGTGFAMVIDHRGTGTNSGALGAYSTNESDSAVYINGVEAADGSLNILHNKPPSGADDANSAALALYCGGAGTKARGIFFDCEQVGGTTGALIMMRQNRISRFVVGSDGDVTVGGHNLLDYFLTRRASEIYTLPDLLAQSIVTLASGTVYGCLAYARNAVSVPNFRCAVGTGTPSALTDVRGVVWDVNGNNLAQTANIATLITTANQLIDQPLTQSLSLTENQLVYVGVAWVGTALGLRGFTTATNMFNNRGLRTIGLTRATTGYTGGVPPTLPGGSFSGMIWFELG